MDKSTAVRSMVFGGIMFIVGLLILASHYAAPDGNESKHYLVAAAAMLFGGGRVVYGIVKLKQSKGG